jgi:outer membrane protein assembly factor BamA
MEGVDLRDSRQFLQDTIRGAIFSKAGEAYSEDAVRCDLIILREMNRFEDVRVSTEQGKKGGVVLHFVVTERPAAH